MSKVFISYSHEDKGYADEIVLVLKDLEVPYFRDVRDIAWGDSIVDKVKQGLDSASTILVIFSPGSLKSQWVPFEVGYALGAQKKILPFLTHAKLDLPPILGNVVYVTSSDQVREFFERNPDWFQATKGGNHGLDQDDLAFLKLTNQMPELLLAMKDSLTQYPFIREFVPLEEGVIFNHGEPRFEFRENDHEHLFGKLNVLENHGFIVLLKEKNYVKYYRFLEPFVDQLLNWNPALPGKA